MSAVKRAEHRAVLGGDPGEYRALGPSASALRRAQELAATLHVHVLERAVYSALSIRSCGMFYFINTLSSSVVVVGQSFLQLVQLHNSESWPLP